MDRYRIYIVNNVTYITFVRTDTEHPLKGYKSKLYKFRQWKKEI